MKLTLAPVQGYLEGYPGVNDPTDLLQDTLGVHTFTRQCLGYLPPEVVEECVLMGQVL